MRVVEFKAEPTQLNGASTTARGNENPHPDLPDWLDVFDGLSDEEVAGIERSILERYRGSREVDTGF
ncbi:hypothetical protein Pla175_15790 [Pirellulimonas nuda]|uniref:Uncharacterized protein n=2 Tax=Pirellulimonas nuda TaxID=2528009 RepID=A0A518D9N4_9BACT|nr:hypothetical protein Pla175_15790 [Pirellulimonas nuda]